MWIMRGGSYASFGCASRANSNVMIDCCVESNGNNSVGHELDGGWDNSGGGSSEQADY